MDKLNTFLDYLAAFTATWNWYVIGSVLASILATIGITAWIKRRHLKKYATKLATEFIVLNVTFWGFIGSVAAFIISNGLAFGGMLPFIGLHWAQISGGAIAVHSIATALHKWFRQRKADKLTDSNIPSVIKSASEVPLTPQGPTPPPPQQVSRDIWGQ